MFISVIIPTYNPLLRRLKQTLDSLKRQTLDYQFWELIVIDNNSSSDFINKIDLSWHRNSKILSEPEQGLTYARLKGFTESKGEIIIMIDDDNLPDTNYLLEVMDIFNKGPRLGAIGGKSIPIFEHKQPLWLNEFYGSLALRNLGDIIIIEEWQNRYPDNAPIGAGMAIRKEALKSYINKITTGKSIISDRCGKSLSSGGDNDIVIEISKSGWQTAYFPALILYHIIPKDRVSVKYLTRLLNNSSKSWIQLLESHNINPRTKIPAWTVPLRKVKAWFVYKAWLSKVNYIKWRGACGTFDGLSENYYSN